MSQSQFRTVATTAAGLGAFMAVSTIGGVYLVVEYLPPLWGFLIPVGSLTVLLLGLWPTRFDMDRNASWPERLGRRLFTIGLAAIVAGLVGAAAVAAWPGYVDWSERQHRAALERRQVPQADIDTMLAEHRLTPVRQLRESMMVTAMSGTLATMITTVAGAILFRRRPTP